MMSNKSTHIRTLATLAILLASSFSRGQRLVSPGPDYNNTLGGAFSGGVFLDKEATFWGIGLDYSRVILSDWVIIAGIAFDREHQDLENGSAKVTNTLSPSIALGYIFNPKFAAGIGLGKGLFDNDNSGKKMKFTTGGNLTVALLGSYSLYRNGPNGFEISFGLERGLITPETDVTVELGYGFSF